MKKTKLETLAKRNFKRPGPTGDLICEISIPALELQLERRITEPKPAPAIASLRRFVRRRLTGNDAALDGARMTVTAIVRKKGGSSGTKRLVTWTYGESLEGALAEVSNKWVKLFEDAAKS